MNTSQAAYATDIQEWLPAQPGRHVPCIQVKAPGRGKALPFDCLTGRLRCVLHAS